MTSYLVINSSALPPSSHSSARFLVNRSKMNTNGLFHGLRNFFTDIPNLRRVIEVVTYRWDEDQGRYSRICSEPVANFQARDAPLDPLDSTGRGGLREGFQLASTAAASPRTRSFTGGRCGHDGEKAAAVSPLDAVTSPTAST